MLADYSQIRFTTVWLDVLFRDRPEQRFPDFVADLIAPDFPDLVRFRSGGGADGAIDLIAPSPGGGRTIFEAKCIGADQERLDEGWAWARAEEEWRAIETRLRRNLPGGAAKLPQYAPWTDADAPPTAYRFCVTAWPSQEAQIRALERKITEFFHDLSRRPSLGHLAGIDVKVLHWHHFIERMKHYPGVAARWFPRARPRRIEPLAVVDDRRTGFAVYLRDIPYLSSEEFAFAGGALLPPEASAATPARVLG